MPRTSVPIYGALVSTLGTGQTPVIWGYIGTGTASTITDSQEILAETQQVCCEQLETIDAYVKRLTSIIIQLNYGKSVTTAVERLVLIESDIRSRLPT
jgi:hypothetical protein